MAKGMDYRKDPTHGHVKAAGSKYLAGKSEQTTVYWSQVDGPSIKAAIDAVTRDGGALVFGRTRDGGALAITLLHDGPPIKLWPNSAINAETTLHAWTDAANTPDD